jgi:hypothetical protein
MLGVARLVENDTPIVTSEIQAAREFATEFARQLIALACGGETGGLK